MSKDYVKRMLAQNATEYYKSGCTAVWISVIISVIALMGCTIILPAMIYDMDELYRAIEIESENFKLFKEISENLWFELMEIEKQRPQGQAFLIKNDENEYGRIKRYDTFLDRLERSRQRMIQRLTNPKVYGETLYEPDDSIELPNTEVPFTPPKRNKNKIFLTVKTEDASLDKTPDSPSPLTTTTTTANTTTQSPENGKTNHHTTYSTSILKALEQIENKPSQNRKENKLYEKNYSAVFNDNVAHENDKHLKQDVVTTTTKKVERGSQCTKKGPPGMPGKDGVPGEDGAPGLPGQNGMDASIEIKTCIICPVGPPGPSGPPGNEGIKGPQGEDGYPARFQTVRKGPRGPPGDIGEPGPDGENGSPGQPGKNGIIFIQGPPGEPGLPGRIGIRGRIGFPGLDGVPGEPGKRGPIGMEGMPGRNGIQGEQGQPGIAGESGVERHYCNCPIRSMFLVALKRQNINVNKYLNRFNKQHKAHFDQNDSEYIRAFKEYADENPLPSLYRVL